MDTIEVGYWIAATLKKDTAPIRCFIGQVTVVDQRGIRVTLEPIGEDIHNYRLFYGYDVFIPWANLESALIATSEHSVPRFSLEAEKWQHAMVKGLNTEDL
jgi:hypothetical protein